MKNIVFYISLISFLTRENANKIGDAFKIPFNKLQNS